MCGTLGCTPGARGASFGDTRYAGNSAVPPGLPACGNATVLSIPVAVSAPSRIYAVGSGVYDSNGSSLALGTIWTELTDSIDSAALAVTGITSVQTGVFNNPNPSVPSSEKVTES